MFVFPSLQAPSSGGFSLDAARGIDLNFAADGLTIAAVGVFLPFFGVADAQGVATYNWPDFAVMIGMDIHYAAATWDLTNRLWLRFTDPVHQPR